MQTAIRKDLESHGNEAHPDWKLHRRMKQRICDQCYFVTTRKETLAFHKKTLEFHKKKEHGVKYPCEECDKVYLEP